MLVRAVHLRLAQPRRSSGRQLQGTSFPHGFVERVDHDLLRGLLDVSAEVHQTDAVHLVDGQHLEIAA